MLRKKFCDNNPFQFHKGSIKTEVTETLPGVKFISIP